MGEYISPASEVEENLLPAKSANVDAFKPGFLDKVKLENS